MRKVPIFNTHITEDDYKKLLARFNPANIRRYKRGTSYGYIRRGCICSTYSCEHCPLQSCHALLSMLGLRRYNFDLSFHSVKLYNRDAVKDIEKIYQYILTIPKE